MCVPGQAPDTLWSESFQYTDKNGLRVPAFAYKDMFIGELGYHNSLPYIDIAEGSAVSVDLTIDQTFEKVSDTQYKATSDHHALLIKNNGNEILELSSCNAEVSLSIINNDNHNGMLDTDYQGMENSKYAGDVLELRVTVPVDGIDYATAGDVVLAKDAIAGGEPQYRAITSLSYVVFFQHFQSQLTLSELLATADVASLFAMSYDHEAYIQTSGVTEKLANVAPELAGGAMLKEYDFTPMPFILTPVVDEVVE